MKVLIFLFVPILAFLALVRGISWARDRRRAKVARWELVCGCCGYRVYALERMICPECGSDLRAAGIGHEGDRHQAPVGGTIGLFLVTTAAVGAIAVALADPLIPPRQQYGALVVLPTSVQFDPVPPASIVADSVMISTNSTIWLESQMRPRVQVLLLASRKPVAVLASTKLEVDPAAGTLSWSVAGKSPVVMQAPIHPNTILEWLTDLGANPADGQTRNLAADTAMAIRVVATPPVLGAPFSNSGEFRNIPRSQHTESLTLKNDPVPLRVIGWGFFGAAVLGSLLIARGGRRPSEQRAFEDAEDCMAPVR